MTKVFISEVANVTKYGKVFHFCCFCCKLWQIFSFQKTVVWQRFSFQGIQFKSMAKFFISVVAVANYGKSFHFRKLLQSIFPEDTVAKYGKGLCDKEGDIQLSTQTSLKSSFR